jgi:phosphate transport system permease protein
VTSETRVDQAVATGAQHRGGRRMSTGRLGDRLFAGAARGSGITILAIMAAIAAFLIWKAIPALQADKSNFLTAQEWNPDGTPASFGIAQLAFGTVLSSFLALIIATPVAIGIALFISFYAPKRLASGLGYVVDLLAAVPSIVYGLWGLNFLVTRMTSISGFLNDYFGWIPLFGGGNPGGRSIFTASVVLAIMILPIISAISREVFLQVPRTNVEAALALGATRWEMIRMAVLPFGRSGVISAAMLGLGRAMGETIAVYMIISPVFKINTEILHSGANSVSALIALKFTAASPFEFSALFAAGLALFMLTLVVNFGASAVIARTRSGALSDA